jgi:transcriptional regulator with XRE-family HTH domain
MTTEEVLGALGRYMKQCNQSDRQTAANLGVKRITLSSWLRGKGQPQKCLLARVAGFLKRVGYLPSPIIREPAAEQSEAKARASKIARASLD